MQTRRARQVLDQARNLRASVGQDLAARSFGSDDLRVRAYNDLIAVAAQLFPQDPVLNGQMVVMPDAVLQAFGTLLPITAAPPDLPSQRLLAYLTRLINRLELLIGEPEVPRGPAQTAADVLSGEQDADVRQILNAIEQLKRPQLGPVDQRDFDFVTDADLRQVLKLDFVEAQLAFGAGAFKACALLAGALIEGMLFDALQNPSVVNRAEYSQAVAKLPRIGQGVNWDKVSMTQLIEAARDVQLLGESVLRLARGARDFRDTIHPRAEVRERTRAAREEAELLLALVKLIYRDLAPG